MRRSQIDRGARSQRALEGPRRILAFTLSLSRPTDKLRAEKYILASVREMECRGKGWGQEGGLAGTADRHVIVACSFLLREYHPYF